MNDERLNVLEPAPDSGQDPSVKIDRIKLSNYKFFHGDFELSFNGENVLIYGENGSGKSSIYKAMELLTRETITRDEFLESRNIFNENGELFVELGFSNGKEYIITEDNLEMPEYMDFLKGLSVFTPMLDYKKLLKVHYSSMGSDKINLYDMLKNLFRNYAIDKDRVLSDIKNPDDYFKELQTIVNEILLAEINTLVKYFFGDMKIERFAFATEFTENDKIEPVVTIEIDYKENIVNNYHVFLNEARLTALAVSIYFAAIKKLFHSLEHNCIKLLVLDDLLISLDMSNRLKLLELLGEQFTDFQIFFFTHDKELFELYKHKMDWKWFELYLDDSEAIQKPLVKLGKGEIERAREFFAKKEYDCCALLLRKEFEKILKSYLTPREQRDKNCYELDLAGLIGRAASKSTDEMKSILEKLNIDRKHILNPLSHLDNRNIYSEELKKAMEDLEKLKTLVLG